MILRSTPTTPSTPLRSDFDTKVVLLTNKDSLPQTITPKERPPTPPSSERMKLRIDPPKERIISNGPKSPTSPTGILTHFFEDEENLHFVHLLPPTPEEEKETKDYESRNDLTLQTSKEKTIRLLAPKLPRPTSPAIPRSPLFDNQVEYAPPLPPQPEHFEFLNSDIQYVPASFDQSRNKPSYLSSDKLILQEFSDEDESSIDSDLLLEMAEKSDSDF